MPSLLIPIFIPHLACHHRCVFCNQHRVTGQQQAELPSYQKIKKIVLEYLSFSPKRQDVQIAFYGGNFLGLPVSLLNDLLKSALDITKEFHLSGIRFSTRPDTVSQEKIELLSAYPITAVEIGAQSMDDNVLQLSGRGHSYQDTVNAVKLLQAYSFKVVIQMMVGLPGDSKKTVLASGKHIAQLQPAGVRIYPTLVLKDSLLEEWYQEGKFAPFDLEKSARCVGKLLRLFSGKNIPVLRIGLPFCEEQALSSVVAGPYHPAFGDLAWTYLFEDLIFEKLLNYGELPCSLTFFTNPKYLSRLRGYENLNIKTLSQKYSYVQFDFQPDLSLSALSPQIRLTTCSP